MYIVIVNLNDNKRKHPFLSIELIPNKWCYFYFSVPLLFYYILYFFFPILNVLKSDLFHGRVKLLFDLLYREVCIYIHLN